MGIIYTRTEILARRLQQANRGVARLAVAKLPVKTFVDFYTRRGWMGRPRPCAKVVYPNPLQRRLCLPCRSGYVVCADCCVFISCVQATHLPASWWAVSLMRFWFRICLIAVASTLTFGNGQSQKFGQADQLLSLPHGHFNYSKKGNVLSISWYEQ